MSRCTSIVLLGTGPEYPLEPGGGGARRDPGAVQRGGSNLPIPRLVALLARAAALITVDSGPAHAAAAVGCPQIVLFGKALPSLYRPWGTAGADVKVLCGQVDGEPSMLGISTADVTRCLGALKAASRAREAAD